MTRVDPTPTPPAPTARSGPSAGGGAGPDAVSGADLGALARGGSLNLVGAALSAVANFLLVLVVARGVTDVHAGLFFAVTSLFLLAETVCRLGADVGLVYFVARWRALGAPERLRPVTRAALVPACLAAAGAGLGLLVLAGPVSRLLGGAETGDSATLIRLLAVFLPVAVGFDLGLAVTRGFDKMGPTVLLEKVLRPVLQLVLVIAVLRSHELALLGLGWVLPYAIVALLTWSAVRALPWPGSAGRTERRAGGQALRRDVRQAFWRFTAPRGVAGMAQILMQRLDIVLVAMLRGPRDAALYTVATRFLVLGQFVNQALAAPVQPQLSRLLARGDLPGVQAVYRTSTAWLVLGVWPVFLLSAIFAPTYLGLFGPGYRSATSTVVVLSLAMLVASGCGLVTNVLIMTGRTSWNLANTLVALGLNVALDIVLIPRIGILGAAIGWAAGITAANLLPLGQVFHLLRLHPFGAETLYAVGLNGACFGLLPLLGGAVGGGVRGAAAGAVAGVALYAVAVWRARRRLHLDTLVPRRGRRRARAHRPGSAEPRDGRAAVPARVPNSSMPSHEPGVSS